MVEERTIVDSTLVCEMLRLSPEERLRQNDRSIANILKLRRAFAGKRDSPESETLFPLDLLALPESEHRPVGLRKAARSPMKAPATFVPFWGLWVWPIV